MDFRSCFRRALALQTLPHALDELESRQLLSTVVVNYTSLPTGSSVAVADFNADGLVDIVTCGSQGVSPAYANIKYGNGQGQFSQGPLLSPSAPLQNTPLFAADFDGDGFSDILAGNDLWYRNLGNGAFAAAQAVSITGDSSKFRIIDFNRDGRQDVLTTDTLGAIKIYQLQGNVFVDAYTLPASVGLTVSDVGDMDLANGQDVLTLDAQGRFVSYLRQSDSTYVKGAAFGSGGALGGLLGFASAADSIPDLYVTGPSTGGDSGKVLVAMGDGSGGFGSPLDTGIAVSKVLMVRDIDSDGRSEMVVRYSFLNNIVYRFYTGGATQPEITTQQSIFESNGSSNRFVDVQYLAAANFAGDSRIDLMLGTATSDPRSPDFRTTFCGIWRAEDPPQAQGGIGLPSSPVIPGQTLTLTASGVTFSRPGGNGQRVTFTIDTNGDGVRQNTEPSFNAALTSPGTWSATAPIADGQLAAGRYHVLASISDSNSSGTTSSSGLLDVWYRVYYPEGWRNDASSNEYVSIANPNEVSVDYVVYARYEVGDRDQIIAQGTISPHSRGGITISEKGVAASALVRANVGYALEVRSSLAMGAFFTHYDNLGTGDAQSTATGEAMSNLAALHWAFADLSTSRFNYLLIYNPYDADTNVTVTFMDTLGNRTPVTFALGGLRRGGLSLRDLPQLAANTSYAASVDCIAPILACQTSYTPATGSGFTAIGQLSTALSVPQVVRLSVGSFEVGGTNTGQIIAFNPQSFSVTITITYAFDSDDPSVQQTILLEANRRVSIVPAEHAAAGAHAVNVRMSADRLVFIQSTTSDTTRADSASTAVATFAADAWAFGDAFMNRSLAGTKFFETLSIANPGTAASDVTIKYLFTDGTFATRSVTLGAGRFSLIALHNEQTIVNHAADSWYSIVVTGTQKIVATLSHWDLLQGGGWSSLGTPLGNVANL